MTTIKYQLDFQPKIYELEIQINESFSCALQQIKEQNNRPDLTDILYNNTKIELEQNINDYDLNNIFIVHGDSITFNIYSNIDLNSMRSPIQTNLNIYLPLQDICDEIKKVIQTEKSRFSPFLLSIYVSGGIKLSKDLYSFLINFHPYVLNIYAVITPDVQYSNLKSRQSILSEYNLSKKSELLIACLAEYIHLGGNKALDFIYTICTIAYFPPIPLLLISLMQRGLTKEPFFHLISLLQTVFLGIYPPSDPKTVFESLPYFCQYICTQYSNSNCFGQINGQLVFIPDINKDLANPINEIWQPPSHLALFSNNFNFHVFPLNSIIRSEAPCFAKNGLILFEKKYQLNRFMNPITKEIIDQKIVSKFLQTLTAKDTLCDIKPANVKQLIIILMDRSSHLYTEKLLQIEKQILKIYTENSCRYRILTLQALMSYGKNTLILSRIGTYELNFTNKLFGAHASGKANVYDAISDAVDYLNAFNWNETAVAYPNAKYRIVLVTTGHNDQKDECEKSHDESSKQEQQEEDTKTQSNSTKPKTKKQKDEDETKSKNSSTTTSQKDEDEAKSENSSSTSPKDEDEAKSKSSSTTKAHQNDNDSENKESPSEITTTNDSAYEFIKEKLIQSDILLDSFIIDEDAPDAPSIARLCHFTGGSCILVDNEHDARKTISQEAFLNVELRQPPVFGDDSSSQLDEQFPNKMQISGAKRSKLISVKQSLPKPSNETMRRIIQEFKYIESLKESSFHVFMDEKNMRQWRVFIKAPPDANLDEKWFYLLINFPEEYPTKPPLFKFISIPYHINISNEGGICLNYLNEEYNSSLTIAYLIICILELLEAPNYDDPIDVNRRTLYNDNREKFFENVRESAKNGKDSYEEWLDKIQEQ